MNIWHLAKSDVELLIAPEGIEMYGDKLLQVYSVGLLIAPEGIEIKDLPQLNVFILLLIAPEGIEMHEIGNVFIRRADS